MNKSAVVDGNSYVISLWLMVAIAWLAADSCGQSRLVGYLCSLVLVPWTFSLWGRSTRLVRGVVGPSGIMVQILLRILWARMYSTWIYTYKASKHDMRTVFLRASRGGVNFFFYPSSSIHFTSS